MAVFVGSATLRAVITTLCEAAMLAGAVYRPLLSIVPTFGERDHVTAVFAVPKTVGVSLCEPPAYVVNTVGFSATETWGTRVSFTNVQTVGSVELVAVIPIVLEAVSTAGAV